MGMESSKRKTGCSEPRAGMNSPIAVIVLAGCMAASLHGQSDVCESGMLHASRIVCESRYLPLELQGFSEYLSPTDPGEVPRKYLVERW